MYLKKEYLSRISTFSLPYFSLRMLSLMSTALLLCSSLSLYSFSLAFAAPHRTIVNLGDSYASGPKLAPIINTACGRSGNNYAHLAASQLHSQLIDVSCSGATTKDFTSSQISLSGQQRNSPQFRALAHPADIVIVSIGGNDAGLVNDVSACALTILNPNECNAIRASSAQKIRQASLKTHQAYQRIRALQPHALIIGVGYGEPIHNRSCVAAPLSPLVTQWVTQTLAALGNITRSSVENVGGIYVDTAALTVEHDICSLQPWYVGLISPGEGQGEIGHPRLAWMQAVAHKIVAIARNH